MYILIEYLSTSWVFRFYSKHQELWVVTTHIGPFFQQPKSPFESKESVRSVFVSVCSCPRVGLLSINNPSLVSISRIVGACVCVCARSCLRVLILAGASLPVAPTHTHAHTPTRLNHWGHSPPPFLLPPPSTLSNPLQHYAVTSPVLLLVLTSPRCPSRRIGRHLALKLHPMSSAVRR